ncbi:unnamed protein product [Durusdinium trenchii]|uniref:Uncharacterized protein n=1 Tax=Durusdinium trenchii TaxID=1381693 RepID=A0ABP0SGI2_9DINO
MIALKLLLTIILGSAFARRLERTKLQSNNSQSCRACGLVDVDRSLAISWGIFPPVPIPGFSVSYYCAPKKSIPWETGGDVDAALEEDCDFSEDLSDSDKQKCQDQTKSTTLRATYLGVPAAFFRQMAVCGRCTLCAAFGKVRALWKKIKAAVQKVIGWLKDVKRSVFGYGYAPEFVREQMQERFDSFFPVDESAGSLAETYESETQKGWETEKEGYHEKMVEKALREHLSDKSPEEAEHHLSLLERHVAEADQQEKELLQRAKIDFISQTQRVQQMAEMQMPGILQSHDCREAIQTSTATLLISLSVSFPNIAAAITSAVLLNFAGALYALIPAVSLSALPRGFEHLGSVDRCLQALDQHRQPYLDGCTHEEPFMACTARTYQRLMEKALSEKWWPLMHNAEGTFGSIDLGYKYDELMNSLRCSSTGSCLEKGLDKLGEADMKFILENNSASESERFTELQCALTANRVDSEDMGKDKLPVFSDKIWAAALKSHGQIMLDEPMYTRSCVDVLPYVAAYCAADLKCMDPDSLGGKGFFDSEDVTAAQQGAEQKVAPLRLLAKKDHLKNIDHFEEMWQELVSSEFDGLKPAEDALQWSEKVLFVSLLRLQIRDSRLQQPEHLQDKRSLSQVVLNLQDIYETKFCSPGALGGLKDEHLQRLGVKDLTALAIHDVVKDSLVKGLWKNWLVLHVKIQWKTTASIRLKRFQDLLAKSACSCMCYDACGTLQASAVSKCQAINKTKSTRPIQKRAPKIRASEVVVDLVTEPGKKTFKNVDLQVIKKPMAGGCNHRLSISGRYLWPPLEGFISKCDLPSYFEQSGKLDLKITIWSSPERADEVSCWQDFKTLHRPYSDWLNEEFDRWLEPVE